MTRTAVLSPALAKEIRALLPFWGATVAVLVLSPAWRSNLLLDLGVFAYVWGSIAIGAQSIGQEYGYRTLPMLLAQPADRERVYLRKFLVSAVMLLTLLALAVTVFSDARKEPIQFTILILPVLGGLFLAPLMTMICRSALAGIILSGSAPALIWVTLLVVASLGFDIDVERAEGVLLDRWVLAMIALSPLTGFLGWRRFTRLEALEAAAPLLHFPRWLTSGEGVRRRSPLRALAAKEVHLQQLTFVVVALNVVGWASFLLVQPYFPSLATFPIGAVLLLYSMGLAIMIGALASAEERHHGTLDWQLLQPTPAWQQWLVKVGVALGFAILFGVGLPILLIELAPRDDIRALRISTDLMVLVALLTTGSIYISSLSSSGVRAMVLSLPVGMAVVYFVQMVSGAMRWVTLQLAGPLMADIVSGAIAPSSLHPADVAVFIGRAFLLTLVPLLLWFGLVNHTSTERTPRRIFQQVAVIALVIAIGVVIVGGTFAFYELRSR